MQYNFDEIIDRRNTNALNTDGFRGYIFHAGPEKVFPFTDEEFVRMWVADMEFACCPAICDAIKKRVDKRIFGYGDGNGAHFDAALADILNALGSDYASDYAEDLTRQDSAGNTVDYRVNMYTPLYYLLESSEGYQESTVAKYWRIRTGIAQGDCALSTEMNLALALENDERVESVDFETIWGAGHTQAERSGNSTDNFIAWVNACLAE